MKKAYRPKAGAENLALSFPAGGSHRDISDWPHETEDEQEQAFLGSHPLVTDRPAKEPKPKSTSKTATPQKTPKGSDS